MEVLLTVAEGRFAPGHLGELTQIVPFEMVDAVLAETGAVQQRVRDLPSRVLVYLLLGRRTVRRVWLPAGVGSTDHRPGRAGGGDPDCGGAGGRAPSDRRGAAGRAVRPAAPLGRRP
jgi:hypothetical protein